MKPEILSSVPRDVTFRRYDSRRDRDALLTIAAKNRAAWAARGRDLPASQGLEHPSWEAVFVIEDAGDTVAAVGARRVAELASVIDPEAMSPHALRDCMLIAWGKLQVALHREGYDQAFCRVTSPTPAWEHMLVKRGGFFPSRSAHYYYDLEAAFARVPKRA